MASSQEDESDDERLPSFEILNSESDSSQELQGSLNAAAAYGFSFRRNSDVCKRKSTVVVEVYEYPDKPIDDLLDDFFYHFSKPPFNATSQHNHAYLYDDKSKTFKLEFFESDAEKILRSEVQNLLGVENEKISVRLFEPQKSNDALLTSKTKISSEKVTKSEMNKFGEVKEVRKMGKQEGMESNIISHEVKGNTFNGVGKNHGDSITSLNLREKRTVEVYEFPDKPIDELLEELAYHFSVHPFNVTSLTKAADMYDNNSKTFKLEFYESDANNILQSGVHDLLGEEKEKIKLRLFEPLKSCTVLLRCEAKLASGAVIKAEMDKFGKVKEIRKMDNTCQNFLVVFCHHEAAVKAANTGAVRISGKQVALSIWDECLDNTETAATTSAPSTEMKSKKVFDSCAEITSPKVLDAQPSASVNAVNTGAVTISGKQVTLSIWDKPIGITETTTAPSVSSTAVVPEMKTKKVVDSCAKITSPKVFEASNEDAKPSDDHSHSKFKEAASENSILLVSNLTDVDNQLLAHWIKTVTGVWPLSCHINESKDKAVVRMPLTLDASLLSKPTEEEYYLHGDLLQISILLPTRKMVAKLNKDLVAEHQDGIELYFNTACRRHGQVVSTDFLAGNPRVLIITLSNHKAISEVTQKMNHGFMDYRIEVGEYYSAAGYCRPIDHFVFPSRKFEASSDITVAKLVVKNLSFNERQYFELFMANRLSGGNNSAKICFSESAAYVSYGDTAVTYAIFDKSQKDGIFLNNKRLEMDLETTELTSIHDHKALRIAGLSIYIDPDRLKFYLSAISENLVISMRFKQDGDRAVAHFKDKLDMLLLYNNFKAIKLEGCEGVTFQPELKPSSLMISSFASYVSTQYLELKIESILSHSQPASVKPVKDVKSAWIVSGGFEEIDRLHKRLSDDKDVKVSQYSEFLGARVNSGIHRKTFLLSDIVKDPTLMSFLLDSQLPGYMHIVNILQNYSCQLSDVGSITMIFNSQQYKSCIRRLKELKETLAQDTENVWCVDKSVVLSTEMYEMLGSEISYYKSKVKLDYLGETLIIAGEKQNVNDAVLKISQAIKEIDDKKREERETRREVVPLKDYEIAYLNLMNMQSKLKDRYSLKELSLDARKLCLIIHANSKYLDTIKNEIAAITSSLCEASISKSELFIKHCENEFAREKILNNLKTNNLVAVCVPDRKKLTAYAKTREIAQMALQCIDEVVWEAKYPEARIFKDDEKELLKKSKHLWEKAKTELIRKHFISIESLDGDNFVVVGSERSNQVSVLREISEFFNKALPKLTSFVGNPFPIAYIARYMSTDLKYIEQNTNAKLMYQNGEITIDGAYEQTKRAEQQLQELYNKIMSAKHSVDGDFHVQFLLAEPEVIEDLGKANKTLIVLENKEKLLKHAPESNNAHSSSLVEIHITPRTTLQVKKAEIHQIHDCDGLIIPTSRNLKLSDLNPQFANYIKEKGGNEIFNECMKSPEAVKGGRMLMPGFILTTSAGEFRDLKKIFHIVLDLKLEAGNVRALEKGLKLAFKSASNEGVMALLIPMSSFPRSFDYNMLSKTIIKTLNAIEDDLPTRLVLLETDSDNLNLLKSLMYEEFQVMIDDNKPALRRERAAASRSYSGDHTATSEPRKLNGNQLLIAGCTFTVVKGLLQESKQQAIVNSTGKNISLQNTALGKALSNAAGPELQVECTSLGPLGEGEVKVSKAYSLRCKSILHCHIKEIYKQNHSEKDLTALIKRCFGIVDQELKYVSVAFPALGTGNFKYPAPVVAKCFVDALKEYTSINTRRHLNEIVVVVIPADTKTYEEFLEVIKGFTGPTQTNPISPLQQDAKEKKPEANTEASLCLNNTKITVKEGDILLYPGKAIVCPSSKELSLEGAVAKKLMEDPYIKRKLEKANKKDMRDHGVCCLKIKAKNVTMPEYRAEYIFLVNTFSQIESVVEKCLEKCKKKKIESIAFPFIGTGIGNCGLPEKDIATKLITSSTEFIMNDETKTIKSIDYLIFDRPKFQIFRAALLEKKGSLKQVSGPSKFHASSKLQDEENKTLHMTIYGMEHSDIQSTKKKLNDRLQKEFVVIQWDKLDCYEKDKSLIAKLSDAQVAHLQKKAKDMDVFFKLDTDLLNIQITGYKSNIYDYRDILKSELRLVEETESKRKFHEYDVSSVIWQYGNAEREEWDSFFWEDSHAIECCHQEHPDLTAKIISKEFNELLLIDLKKKSFRCHGKSYSIKRCNKANNFPVGWDEIAGELAEVALKPESPDYKSVVANFRKTIQDPNAQILEVLRVQHLAAYRQYMEQRRFVARKLKMTEAQVERVPLWHGTQEDTVRKIAKSIFDRGHAGLNAMAYGQGSYFARDASYSAQRQYSRPNAAGEKYMFQARVIVGEYTLGKSDMKYCPSKTDGTSYDSVVDNIRNPSIFVVFHDTAAYPEYIIKFKM